MSLQEIIEELPKLPPAEREVLRQKLNELQPGELEAKTSWGKALLEIAGGCPDLPPDLSENHDHYLYGSPKRTSE